ncbi:5-oxoprolinase subunit PxpB [Terrimonas sp. NA20]|uniref:5-oxoprolinase subunit PxpB n=1 Tax=Terrimonas ginsenosidimutans TaxID=2908004 RepID=A0ABS9KLB1_9BACT|nr:5-oxoprolinase subunit PxpB [Terrimonas ginsenosidimutans]MCG2613100.1 5-oxoprolinase subunit PxpB [Terrimonas ginsenosidimutans]
MSLTIPYHIFPLGDSAMTVDFGSRISPELNSAVMKLYHELQLTPLPGMVEAVPAYSSLSVHYDLLYCSRHRPAEQTVFEWMGELLDKRLRKLDYEEIIPSREVVVPVCYDISLAPDLEMLARERNLSVEEVIHLHQAAPYRVYLLGFLPGFTYLGETDERIAMPRKMQPSPVVAGSVGIAGRQTGIYSLSSPGGWNIIGRTPLKLFDKDREPLTLLKPGDIIKFVSISKDEFEDH